MSQHWSITSGVEDYSLRRSSLSSHNIKLMSHALYTYHLPTTPLTLPCYSVVQISELFHLLAHSGLSRNALGSISIVNCRVHMVDVYTEL